MPCITRLCTNNSSNIGGIYKKETGFFRSLFLSFALYLSGKHGILSLSIDIFAGSFHLPTPEEAFL